MCLKHFALKNEDRSKNEEKKGHGNLGRNNMDGEESIKIDFPD
jgi:hypothetical protein